MTHVEVLNIVREHLVVHQRAKSQIDAFCMYRDLEGRKCAIGVLIPDDVYVGGMEDLDILSLSKRYPELCVRLKNIDILFLRDLQGVHDVELVEDWPELFDALMPRAVALDAMR